MDRKMKKLSLKYQLKSFGWAFKGLSVFFKTEVKAKIHTVALVIVILTGFYFKITLIEWCLVIFASGLVILSEIFNTILEITADTLPDKFDMKRGIIKDMSAGAVLLSSFLSVVIGLLIFIPKIIESWW